MISKLRVENTACPGGFQKTSKTFIDVVCQNLKHLFNSHFRVLMCTIRMILNKKVLQWVAFIQYMYLCLYVYQWKKILKKNNFQTLNIIVMARHKLTLEQTPKPTLSLLYVCSRSGRGLLFKTLCLIWVRSGSATDLLEVRSWSKIYALECETNLGLFLLTACRPAPCLFQIHN